jgi:hypothetical protein
MNQMLHTGTWRRKNGLATWQHFVPTKEKASPAQALCDAAVSAWEAMEDFVTVRSASWTSISMGEDARVEPGANLDAEHLRSICADLGDATRLDLDLDLRCVGLDGAEGVIEAGGKLVLDLDWSDPSSPGEGQAQLDVVLRLDADIYAPRTGGDQPDNSALAALNGPKLTAFLRRLRSKLGATLVDLDAYAGRGTLDEDGWVQAQLPGLAPQR